MELFAMIKQILYAFSFVQLFIRPGLTAFSPCFELGALAYVNHDRNIQRYDYQYIGHIYEPSSDSETLRLPSPCLLIQYDKEKCEGITIIGSLAYNDLETHTIDVISKEKSETNGIGRGWRTSLTVRRIDVADSVSEMHVYEMTFQNLFEFEIVSGAKQEETSINVNSEEWFPQIMNRFNGYYGAVSFEENGYVGLFATCTQPYNEEDDYSLKGGWIQITPPLTTSSTHLAEIDNQKNQYERFNSLTKLETYFDPL